MSQASDDTTKDPSIYAPHRPVVARSTQDDPARAYVLLDKQAKRIMYTKQWEECTDAEQETVQAWIRHPKTQKLELVEWLT